MTKLKNLTLYVNLDRVLQLLLHVTVYLCSIYIVVSSGSYLDPSGRCLIIVYGLVLMIALYCLPGGILGDDAYNEFFLTPWLLSYLGVSFLVIITSEHLFAALTVSYVLSGFMFLTTIAAPAGAQVVEPAKAPVAAKAPAVKKTWVTRFRESALFDLLCALCIGVFLFCICPFRLVSGSSMLPTMEEGTIACKINDGAYEQGDIVMAYSADGTYRVVKRIIGLPGDTVCCMADGDIYVNGELLVLEGVTLGSTENLYGYSETVLGEDEYFLVGDNRRYSSDSRSPTIGAFTLDQIVSEVVVIW